MALAIGSRVGSYEVLAPIGAGGMGEVYRLRDTRLNRDVALKVLPDAVSGDATAAPASSARRSFSRRSIIRTSRTFMGSRTPPLVSTHW